MSVNLPASITGAAQTGFTSPTYTLTVDQQPDINAKQSVVTAVGGTQAGVTTHTVSSPFYVSIWKPKVLAMLGKPNPSTGLIDNVRNNVYKVLTGKGVTPAAGQPAKTMGIRTEIPVPAGAETYDIANVRAGIAAHIGLLQQISAGLGDTANNGVI